MSKRVRKAAPDLSISMMLLASGYAFSSLLLDGPSRTGALETKSILGHDFGAEGHEPKSSPGTQRSGAGTHGTEHDHTSLKLMNAEFGPLAVS